MPLGFCLLHSKRYRIHKLKFPAFTLNSTAILSVGKYSFLLVVLGIFEDGDAIFHTYLIGYIHKLLYRLLVGVILFPVRKTHRIEYKMRMYMLSVDVSCNYTFLIPENFFSELTGYFVSKLGGNIISFRE